MYEYKYYITESLYYYCKTEQSRKVPQASPTERRTTSEVTYEYCTYKIDKTTNKMNVTGGL